MSRKESLKKYILKNFLIGLIVLTPFVATFYVTVALLNFLDSFLFNLILPEVYHPKNLLGVPGIGFIITLLIVFFCGVLTNNFFGKALFIRFESAVKKIPILSPVYFALRQFVESILLNSGSSFNKAIAIEYPRKGIYSIAFVTGKSANYLQGHLKGSEVYTVFLPTTPNPTSGFYLVVPIEEAIEIPLKVEEAFKLVVSGGVLSDSKESFMDKIHEKI